jgi:hypothetical protein
MAARTVINYSELPGGPRAAPLDARWPLPLAPGAHPCARDLDCALPEEGQIMAEDGVGETYQRTGPVPVRRDCSDWMQDLLDMDRLPDWAHCPDLSVTPVRANLAGINGDIARAIAHEVRFVAQGSHSMGRGNGGNRAARLSWARL